MMLLTAEKCTKLRADQNVKGSLKTQNGNDNRTGKRLSVKDRKGSLKQEEKNSVPLEEKRPLVSKVKSKRLKDSFNNDSDNSTQESNVAKVVKEPSDLYVSTIHNFALLL